MLTTEQNKRFKDAIRAIYNAGRYDGIKGIRDERYISECGLAEIIWKCLNGTDGGMFEPKTTEHD